MPYALKARVPDDGKVRNIRAEFAIRIQWIAVYWLHCGLVQRNSSLDVRLY
jgi:hypothetical protein